jgi:regulator of CtrA degradation
VIRHNASEETAKPVFLAKRLLASDGFRALFQEGMALVEETAGYLDGRGREESRALQRSAALAYATESMRLTTRLMQMTSWLLLQRAVNEGELTREEADSEHRKVRLVPTDAPVTNDLAVLLPEKLQALISASLRLQQRIVRLDELARSGPDAAEAALPSPVALQIDHLQRALRQRG